MPLLEILAFELGGAVTKSIVKSWIPDSNLWDNASSSAIDILKSMATDRLTQRKAQRLVEDIGERVGKSLLPLFQGEGARLDEGSRTTVANAVANAFNNSTVSSETLVAKNLDPDTLSKEILAEFPANKLFFNEAETSFYQRIVEEACRYVVNIAASLPEFSERTFAEVLKREDLLLGRVEKILKELELMRKELDPEVEDERFELEYREAVARNLDVLQLIGADVSLPNRRHRLSVAYITLSVEQQGVGVPVDNGRKTQQASSANEREREEAKQDEALAEIVPVNQALAGARRLLIRGAAGSGKTTLLQWIAVRAATKTFTEELEDWNRKLPFYIRLRQCMQYELPKPENLPSLVAPMIAGKMPVGWVHRKLEFGQVIVLVDGVDEVPETRREEVHSWLRDLVSTYPNAFFLVTSRPHAIPEGWMNHTAFSRTDLQEMTLSDIFVFIEHWHRAVEEEVISREERDELGSLAQHLKKEIASKRQLRMLATNPLLCAMLCALNRERRQQLPVNRIQLYRACCELLLERREKESRIDLPEHPTLHLDQKERLLQDLAFWMMQEGLTEVATERVEARFEQKLAHMPNLSDDTTGKRVRKLLVERASLLREVIAGQIEFTHRTFEEFYTGRETLNLGAIKPLIKQAHDQQWREVVILVSGLAPKQICEQLIDGLIRRGDAEPDKRHTLYLLAVACLETAIELDNAMKNEVEQRLSRIMPPKNMTEAKIVAAAGELAVKYLGKKERLSASTSAACVRSLSLIGSEAALDMLEEYAQDRRERVKNELWRGWDMFDTGMYAQRIIMKLLHEETSWKFHNVPSLDGFHNFRGLTKLDLSGCSQIHELAPLASLSNLTTLDLSGCSQIHELAPLASLSNLTTLDLSGCSQIHELAPLASLSNLTWLDLSGCSQIHELALLASLSNLTWLDLSGCSQIHELAPLASLSNLTWLDLSGCSQIHELAPLASLSNLTTLDLSGCEQLVDLAPLASLSNLTFLDLSMCRQLVNLAPLDALRNLNTLNLFGCEQLVDLTLLDALTNLTTLRRP